MAISLTPAAAERVKSFIATRGKGLGLRLGVRKTGCSGFAYVVNYADDSAANLRELMHLPSLEDVFSQLAVKDDVESVAGQLLEAVRL